MFPRVRSLDSDHRLGVTPHPPSRRPRALGGYYPSLAVLGRRPPRGQDSTSLKLVGPRG